MTLRGGGVKPTLQRRELFPQDLKRYATEPKDSHICVYLDDRYLPLLPFRLLKLELRGWVAFRISNAWRLENHLFETLQQSEPRDTQRI